MSRSPFRNARAAAATADTGGLIEALAELGAARSKCEALRTLVATGQAGAASLTTSEWQLHQALQRVDRIRSQAEYQPPTAA